MRNSACDLIEIRYLNASTSKGTYILLQGSTCNGDALLIMFQDQLLSQTTLVQVILSKRAC